MPKSKHEKQTEAQERQAARDARSDEQQLSRVEEINPACREAVRLRERLSP